MPKRKKHPRLPSGFGSIRYLGSGRTNPYAVHEPATERDDQGRYKKGRVICYVQDWFTGFAVLNAWNAGTYVPGMELTFRQQEEAPDRLELLVKRIIADHRAFAGAMTSIKYEPTFGEIFDAWFDDKFGEHARRKLSESRRIAVETIERLWMQDLRPLPISILRIDKIQAVVDACPYATTQSQIVQITKAVFAFAMSRQIITDDQTSALQTVEHRTESAKPFTPDQIHRLWSMRDEPHAAGCLIMIYSGFRVAAIKTLDINLESNVLTGGVKTEAGKGRVVPVHPAIRDLLAKISRIDISSKRINHWLGKNGFDDLSAHSCRHTFSALCEKYGVRENDRKRMLGHAFKGDVTNAVYGHRDVEDLRKEIEKIPWPEDL